MTTLSERILGLKKPVNEVVPVENGIVRFDKHFDNITWNAALEAAAAIIGDVDESKETK